VSNGKKQIAHQTIFEDQAFPSSIRVDTNIEFEDIADGVAGVYLWIPKIYATLVGSSDGAREQPTMVANAEVHLVTLPIRRRGMIHPAPQHTADV